ncbi:MAG: RluA family pseudouridine synthase [Thermoleophilaceae bacterium]
MSDLELLVGPDDAGERLDAVLVARAGLPSRAAAQRLLEEGAVSVDGQRRLKGFRVSTGERLLVTRAEEGPSARGDVPFEIVFEDDHLLVVDKPAGVVVHPAPGTREPTLADALRDRTAGGPSVRQGLVHRLDRDTSGLMALAKSERAYEGLQAMIRAHEVTREYLTLVAGSPDADEGTVDAPIGRDRMRRTVVSTRSDRARAAVTHFRVLERLDFTSLLRVRLETGRTHQIRAHLAAIGNPVCGDRRYGGRECGARLGLERQFLHSATLMFSHPIAREIVRCESKPPADLRRALDAARREPVSGGPDGG